MRAIETRIYPPTNHRGCRVAGFVEGKRVFVAQYKYELSDQIQDLVESIDPQLWEVVESFTQSLEARIDQLGNTESSQVRELEFVIDTYSTGLIDIKHVIDGFGDTRKISDKNKLIQITKLIDEVI
jgi:hypothetical protein